MRRPLWYFIIFLGVLLVFESCAPSRFIKPLDEGESAVNLTLGGPMIEYGDASIPIPFVTATYGYGIDSSLTAFSSFNITSALYGNFQMEFGVVKQLAKQNRYWPAISISPVINIIYRDLSNYKIHPQFNVIGFWEYGKRDNFFYLGIDNWFELSNTRAFDLEQSNHWFLSPLIGHVLNGNQWTFNFEIKLIAPYLSNEKIVVDYISPVKNKGALGIYFGITRKF